MQGILEKNTRIHVPVRTRGVASLLVNLDLNLVRAQEAKGNLPHLGDLMNNAVVYTPHQALVCVSRQQLGVGKL